MISIIVPVHNVEIYLDKCLKSIMAQTFKDIEVIIIDDGSTDASLQIAKNYEGKDHRVHLYTKINGGQVSAWKMGLEKSSGNYIGFVDSDDWIDETMYEKLYQPFQDYDIQISACSCRKIYADSQVDELEDAQRYHGLHEFEELVKDKNNFYNSDFVQFFKFYRWNKLFKRELIVNNVKYSDDSVRVFEDNCLVIPCLLDAENVFFIGEHLYNYRQHDNSTMKTFSPSILSTNRRVVEILATVFNDRKIFFDKDKEKINMCLFSVSGILQSSIPKWKKHKMLDELAKDIANINTKPYVIKAPLKHKYVIKMLQKRKFKRIVFIYNIFNKCLKS